MRRDFHAATIAEAAALATQGLGRNRCYTQKPESQCRALKLEAHRLEARLNTIASELRGLARDAQAQQTSADDSRQDATFAKWGRVAGMMMTASSIVGAVFRRGAATALAMTGAFGAFAAAASAIAEVVYELRAVRDDHAAEDMRRRMERLQREYDSAERDWEAVLRRWNDLGCGG